MMNKEIVYYHFTRTENVGKILKEGLIPKIGENANGVEDSKKVFFSKGKEGCLKLIDVWIRWYIVRYQRIAYAKKETEGVKPSPINDSKFAKKIGKALKKHHKAVQRGDVETEEAKLAAFKKMYKDWRNSTYLALDLVEGEDFSSFDVDEAKQRQCKSKAEKQYLEYMYGKIDNPEGLEDWNMHTFKDKSLEPKKIDIVNSRQNGLDFILEAYEEVKPQDLPLLDEFIGMVKQKVAGQNINISAKPQDHLENPGMFEFLL